jgi:hypothetical protein
MRGCGAEASGGADEAGIAFRLAPRGGRNRPDARRETRHARQSAIPLPRPGPCRVKPLETRISGFLAISRACKKKKTPQESRADFGAAGIILRVRRLGPEPIECASWGKSRFESRIIL